jgi:hypothetical protein
VAHVRRLVLDHPAAHAQGAVPLRRGRAAARGLAVVLPGLAPAEWRAGPVLAVKGHRQASSMTF